MNNGHSITGTKHSANQDSFFVAESFKNTDFGLYIVADGMGGHAAGDIASSAAIEEITEKITEFSIPSIAYALEEANRRVHLESLKAPELEGMGTTVVLCAIKGENVIIAHVGDSRAYIAIDGKIEYITKDHSYVQQLVDNGEITEEEAKTHPMKNIITNAVGVQESMELNITEKRIKKGSVIVLCSDGVSNVTDDEEIIKTAKSENGAELLCKNAMNYGNTDDATAVVINL